MNVTHEIQLCTFPCGCVLPLGEHPRALWHVAYACPWCDAVFSRPDLLHWFQYGSVGPPMLGVYRQVLRVGESIVEAGEHCGCGMPMVRELSRGAKWGHLRAPLLMVEVLSD